MINYLEGDATAPIGEGPAIIAHICNDLGAWGKGFVLAVSKKWPAPEVQYKQWHSSSENFQLGEVQFVQVSPLFYVANMIGQKGIRRGKNRKPIRYVAVEDCLQKVAEKALELGASVHMPRIGCGLAGGTWEEIEPIIQRCLTEKGISVYIYDFQLPQA